VCVFVCVCVHACVCVCVRVSVVLFWLNHIQTTIILVN